MILHPSNFRRRSIFAEWSALAAALLAVSAAPVVLAKQRPSAGSAPPDNRRLKASDVAGAAGHSATRPTTAPSDVDVEDALGRLRDGDWVEQWEAMDSLATWHCEQAVEPLQKILAADATPWLRSQALLALARLRPEQTLDQAITLSQSGDPAMKQAALRALAAIGLPRGIDAAAKLLDDPSVPIRNEALAATGRLRRAEAWNLIAPHLKLADPLYAGAVRAAAWVPTDEARKALDTLMANKDARPPVLRAVAQAQDPAMIPMLLARIPAEKDRWAIAGYESTLASFGDQRLYEPLLDAIKGDRAGLYPTALRLLAPALDREGCDLVAARLSALGTADPASLAPAFELLIKFDPEAYVKVIAPYLKADQPEVRRAAAVAVARARSADQFSLMHDLLTDRDPNVRSGAYQTLRRSTHGAPPRGIVPYLAPALSSAEKEIYRPALELLQERLTRTDIEPAIAALGRFLGGADREMRDSVTKTLAIAADEAGLELIARAQGYCAPWMVIGPFLADEDDHTILKTAFGPETQIDFSKAYDGGIGTQVTWSLCQMSRTDGTVDLAYAYTSEDEKVERARGNGPRVAYGAVDLVADTDKPTLLTLTAQQGALAWLNGQRLELPARAGDPFEIRLHKGPNHLLVKIATNDPKNWSFRVRTTEKDGSRAAGVTSALQTPTTQPAGR